MVYATRPVVLCCTHNCSIIAGVLPGFPEISEQMTLGLYFLILGFRADTIGAPFTAPVQHQIMALKRKTRGSQRLHGAGASRHHKHLSAGTAVEIVVMRVAGHLIICCFAWDSHMAQRLIIHHAANCPVYRCNADARPLISGEGMGLAGHQRSACLQEYIMDKLFLCGVAHGSSFFVPRRCPEGLTKAPQCYM